MRANDPDLKVEIKLVNNPYDIKANKNYFQKKGFELPSNLDEKKMDPVAQYEVENEHPDNHEERKKQFDENAADFPNHTFVTFLSQVKIQGVDKKMGFPQINSLICSSKAPNVVRRLPNYDLDSNPSREIKVAICLRMNHTHSEALNYVSRNFHRVALDPDIGLLTPHELKLILKHKYLNVEHED